MKKTSCFVMAVLVTASFAPWANAQTQGLTLYGVADMGFSRLSNVAGSPRTLVDSGVYQPSRLGFRGREDLGGGMEAFFEMATTINMDTGTTRNATTYFDRGAFVGLKSRTWGSLSFGRQYDFLYLKLPPDAVTVIGGMPAGYNGFANNTLGAASPAVDAHFGGNLYNNSVKWEHQVGGVSMGLMYGLGNENKRDKAYSALLRYDHGPFQLGFAWAKDNFTTAVFANQVWALHGAYRFDRGYVFAGYAETKETVFAGSKARNRPAEIGVNFDVTPVWSVGGGIGIAQATNRAGAKARLTQPFAGTKYRLSKNTFAYAVWARVESSDPGAVPASLNGPGGAPAPSTSDSQSNLRVGFNYRF